MAGRHEDQARYKLFTRRSLLLAGGQGLLLSALVGRMYYLQVVESDRYKTLAEDNRINLRLVAPPRGRIVDRFGRPLAVNQQNYRLMVVREQTPDVAATLRSLARIIPLPPEEQDEILREVRAKRAFVPVTLAKSLTWEQVTRIEANAPELPGISIEVGRTRFYPQGQIMAPVLGYVAAVSEQELTGDPLLELPDFRIGKNGVERQHDQALRGSAGTSQIEVNAVGRVIRELERDEGRPGRELVLTVDSQLQQFVAKRIKDERSAAAVLLDVESGDVLALASQPSFDSNTFAKGIPAKTWHALTNDPLSPLTNKAIAGSYSPGSTFKMIVALAALEAGVDPSFKTFCPGFYKLGNGRFHCWKRHGHGWLDMVGSLKHSCDVHFYEIARKAGIDRISDMARRFGYGELVGLDLPGERPGLLPTREWKLANFDEPWQGGETLVTAIGQGFILATPLQLAVMTARLATGKAVTPRLARGFQDDPVERLGGDQAFAALDIPEAHLKIVRRGMDAVTNEQRGTAYAKRIDIEGWEMAGKTGTAQVRRITLAERQAGVKKNEELPWRFRDHALFVGYAPVHKPRYCCAVVVEHGGSGSKAAAPIVRDILTETQRVDPAGTPALPMLAAAPTGEG